MESMSGEIDDSRRGFLRTCSQALVGITIVGTVAPALGGCEVSIVRTSDSLPDEFDVSSLTADNQALLTATNAPDGAPLAIVRKSAAEYLALSTVCTHQSCPLNAPKNMEMTCPCHGSRFDLSGNVLNGPATSPLKRYPATYNPNTRTVKVSFS